MIDNIKFFGIPIFKSKRTKYYDKKYILGIRVWKSEKEKHWYDDFVKDNLKFKNQYMYFCGTPLGEASIFARTLPFWYEKGVPIVCARKQHINVFRLFAPDVPIIYKGKGGLADPIRLNDNYFNPILGAFSLFAINHQKKHFFKQWEKYLNADFSEATFPKAIISEEDRKSALKKLRQKRINLDKYIFVMKDANSIRKLNPFFWLKLSLKLKRLGFDVVCNSEKFSMAEAYAITEKAKALISLRSGFNDILSEIEVPQFLIYSKSRCHDDLQPMYTMKGFPWAANSYITEYNTTNQKAKDIISDILEKIESKEDH